MKSWPAPAKLNLFLHVVGRRGDGYHELQTLFQLLDFADVLHFEVRNDGVIRREGGADLPERDLTVRAACKLQQFAGTGLGVDITLDKRIPVGAGLGGGSSDAATVLLALNRLWEVHASIETLVQLGAELGADVPVFIHGHSAWGEGVGEKVTPAMLSARIYCVVVPEVMVSTAAVFNDSELTRNTPRIRIPSLFEGGLSNDLEPVTCRLYPEVGEALVWLRQFGEARMTGSGCGLYVVVSDRRSGEDILEQAPAGIDGFVAAGINQHPLKTTEPVGV